MSDEKVTEVVNEQSQKPNLKNAIKEMLETLEKIDKLLDEEIKEEHENK